MKKYPKIVQCDRRGQIVIPKDVRQELDIEEGAGFWVFTIHEEGILLKKIKDETLSDENTIIQKLSKKSEKIKLKKENIAKSIKNYKRTKGNLEEI